MSVTAYLSLGANKDHREKNIEMALKALSSEPLTVIRLSTIYETEPVGTIQQNWFLNCTAEIETELSPEELLKVCKSTEIKMGRKKTVKWGPRKIDIDVLLYGSSVITSKELTIPHKEMHKRNFVLIPLCELCPEKIHPLLNKSMLELSNECSDKSQVRRI